MEKSYLNHLYIISFLDSVNLGLIMPVLNPHLLSIGGSHTTTGLLVSLHCIAQILATILIKGLYQKYNKRLALIYTLIVALISNLVLAVTTSFWVVFAARLAFYLTNQTQTVLYAYVRSIEHSSKHDIINGVFGALGVSGFLVGPIISGYIFEWNNGFSYVSILASGISLLSISFVLFLPILPNEVETIPNLTLYIIDNLKVSSNLAQQKLSNGKVQCNWNIYLLKVLVTTSLTAFFMKFSMLLKKHYNASSVMIGYTVAYQSMVMFLMNFVLLQVKSLLSPNTKTQLVQILSTSLIAMVAICYAITHGLYMTLFLPVALSRLLLDSMWPSLVYADRGPEVSEAASVFTTITAIVIPIVLGNFCDIYDQHAVKMFAIMPLLCAILLIWQRFEPVQFQASTQTSQTASNFSEKKKLVDYDFSDESQSFEKRKVDLKND